MLWLYLIMTPDTCILSISTQSVITLWNKLGSQETNILIKIFNNDKNQHGNWLLIENFDKFYYPYKNYE